MGWNAINTQPRFARKPNDDTTAAPDPFPPSQRHISGWNSEQDGFVPSRPQETASEGSDSSVLLTQEMEQYRERLRRIMEPSSTIDSQAPSQRALGKRPADKVHPITTTTVNAETLRQKRQRLMAMDDWTGAKAHRPLEIQFQQFDRNAPAWGWSETEPCYAPPPASVDSQVTRSNSTPRPLYSSFSVKRYSPLPSTLGYDIYEPRPARNSSKSSLVSPEMSRHSQQQIARTGHLFPDEDYTHVPIRQTSRLSHAPRSCDPSGSFQALIRPDEPISGTLSAAEQQRFESEGLAILSPSVPTASTSEISVGHKQQTHRATESHFSSSQQTLDDCDPIICEHNTPSQPPESPCLILASIEDAEEAPIEYKVKRSILEKQGPEGEISNKGQKHRPSPADEHEHIVELLGVKRITVRDIPNHDASDDPIEDSESEAEYMRQVRLQQAPKKSKRGRGRGP